MDAVDKTIEDRVSTSFSRSMRHEVLLLPVIIQLFKHSRPVREWNGFGFQASEESMIKFYRFMARFLEKRTRARYAV
jgi:hypothetical protein